MESKDTIIRKLSKGYTPQGEGAKPRIAKVYDLTFKPLVNRKKLELFFELYEHDDPIVKAWAFLGIYQVLENKSYESKNTLNRLNEIINDILHNSKEISFFSGSIETETTLRQHHAKRISWLDPYFVFDAVFEYCEDEVGHIDKVVSSLLKDVLSQRPDSKVEALIIKHAKNTPKNAFDVKLHLLESFENLEELNELTQKEELTNILKEYLKNLEGKEEDTLSDLNKKRRILKDTIIEVGAKLELDLEAETLSFLESLQRPYSALNLLAKRYHDNDQFRNILLEKLESTKNLYFITDILRAIIVLKDKIKNWKELVIENVKKYELSDADLIIDLTEANLLNEEMLVNYLQKGTEWHLEFIREFVTTHPEKLDQWNDFRQEVIQILRDFEGEETPETMFYKKKRLALRLVVDLKWDKGIELCLENFKNLQSDELQKIALFAMITSRDDDILTSLRREMDKDKGTELYVRNFWKYLEGRDWQFFY